MLAGHRAADLIWMTCLLTLAWGGTAAAQEPPQPLSFNRDVRPILADKCFPCHGPDAGKRQAELRLDHAENALADRGGYAAIVPRRPDESEVVKRIRSEDADERMPPADFGKLLSADEIQILLRWVAEGGAYEPHWSYVPPRRWPLPPIQDRHWPRDEIDVFLLAQLETRGLRPAAEADRTTLARRIHFDLTGLPPSSATVRAFVEDTRPDAYERLVDGLLESPHFGERMAMFWLDLVRYADSVGYHGDQEHHIAPYRDYVIGSFNSNKPFDQFTVEQLAGDLLPQRAVDQWVASGYNRLLQTSHEGGVQVKEYLAKYSADRVRNFGEVWLGATLGCAECHDHKYDPFTQRDFYSVAAFFSDVDDIQTFRGGDTNPTRREPEIDVLSPNDRRLLEQLRSELATVAQQITAAESGGDANQRSVATVISDDQLAAWRARREQLNRDIENLNAAQLRTMVTVSIEPRPIRVLQRGDWMDESGEVVAPHVPEFLPPLDSGERRATRLDLAEWLTNGRHPLTARVFVNRLWAMFFGNGLCPSLEDLGSQGQPATYPELLDQLSVDFVERGWDVKRLVRRIVTSSAYRQSSIAADRLREIDPQNRWFARQARFRLPAESVRDNALAVSGLLVRRMGGQSARPYQPEGYYAPLNFPKRSYVADRDENQFRRGVYMHWQRQFLHPMLKAFDAPSREECTAQRPVSNTPLAALTLLNDPTFVEAARVFAEQILRQPQTTTADRVRWAWQQATSREPADAEVDVLEALVRFNREQYAADPEAARKSLSIGLTPVASDVDVIELATWTQVTRALLNLNETITRN
jgi:hypothetical protein